MPREHKRWQVLLAFAAVYIVWGSTYLAIRFAIETIPPFLMAGTRFLTAGALLLTWSRWRGAPWPRMAEWRTAAILGGLLLLCGNGGVTWAEQRVPSGLTALLVASEPLWLVLLGWAAFRKQAPTRAQVLGLLIGFAGVAFLVMPQPHEAELDLLGAGLILASAFAWAAGSLYATRATQAKSPVTANGMIMVMGGLFLSFAGVITGEPARLRLDTISAASALAFVYLMLFGSLIAFTAYTFLLEATTPAKASTYAYVNPVVAVLLGWGLAGEPLSSRSLFAMALIVGAVVLMTWTHKTAPVREAAEELEPVAVEAAAD